MATLEMDGEVRLNLQPLTVKRDPRSQSIAQRLTAVALSSLLLLDARPTRSRVYIGDALPGKRGSFKANRRAEPKARAMRRGLRY